MLTCPTGPPLTFLSCCIRQPPPSSWVFAECSHHLVDRWRRPQFTITHKTPTPCLLPSTTDPSSPPPSSLFPPSPRSTYFSMTAGDITTSLRLTLRLSNVTLPICSLVAPKAEVMTISAIEHGPLGAPIGPRVGVSILNDT